MSGRLPASLFGPYQRDRPAELRRRRLDRIDRIDRIVVPDGTSRLHVLCLRPLHHALELAALQGLLAGVRQRSPPMEIRLYVRSALASDAAFAPLPVDRTERLPADEVMIAALRSRLAGLAALAAGGEAVAVLAGEGNEADWFRAGAVDPAFPAALLAETPRWRVAPGAGSPPAPRSLLIHQARFRVGDALWLTPLLRAVRRAFPAAAVTVAAGPLARPVLERNPHLSELLVWDPAAGEAGRRPVLERLDRGDRGDREPFDAALFALARRDKSRWLAEAVARRGVPCRVNLEYFASAHDGQDGKEGGEDGGKLGSLFTHEGWFFWGAVASPRLLLHALDPWEIRSARQDDRRVEMPVSAEERREADRVLAAAGAGEGPFSVLAPAGHSSDRWPPERYAALAARLADELGHSVLLEGAPADAPLLRAVEESAASVATTATTATAAGLLGEAGARRRVRAVTDPLGVLAALLERAALLVSNDSGPIHVAEAAGAPTLYFAHREKLVHSHPAGEGCWALWDDEENRPADISVEQALGAVHEMARRGLLRRTGRTG